MTVLQAGLIGITLNRCRRNMDALSFAGRTARDNEVDERLGVVAREAAGICSRIKSD